MKNHNKFLFILIGIAIFSGILCSGIIIASGIQNGSQASARRDSPHREKYPEPHVLEKTKLEEFSEISICLNYAEVSILPSDDFYLEYSLDGKCSKPDYGVSDGKFHFQEGQTQNPYRISLNLFHGPVYQEPFYMNLYVPKEQYFDLIHMSIESGNLEIDQLNAKKADLFLTYGNLNLGAFTGDTLEIASESGNIDTETVTCGRLTLSNSYGDYTGDTVSVSEKGTFSLESGNLKISSLTGGNYTVNSMYGTCTVDRFQAEKGTFSLESGDLEISSLTADAFFANASYGNCTIDSFQAKNSNFSLESGNLTLKQAVLEQINACSEYGNVTLKLAEQAADFNYDLDAEYGAIQVNGKKIEENEDGATHYQKQDSQNARSISVQCESGNITIK